MSQVNQQLLNSIKEAVRQRLEEVGHSWQSQSKMNISGDDYGDGYGSAQAGCADNLFEVVDEIMCLIDQKAEHEDK